MYYMGPQLKLAMREGRFDLIEWGPFWQEDVLSGHHLSNNVKIVTAELY